MLKSIIDILDRCGSDETVIPPTTLYNEGWLLRVVLNYLHENRDVSHPLSFSTGSRWYSEALLPSRFLPKPGGQEPRPESHTHADGVIGHFHFCNGRGEVNLDVDAKQFTVIEAKLSSPLSPGTKHAPDFDQAARNVACMAHMLGPRVPEEVAFYVVAPKCQIDYGVFRNLVTKDSIADKVKKRVKDSPNHEDWFTKEFLPVLRWLKLGCLSWERVIDALPSSPQVNDIRSFYAECLKWNSLDRARPWSPRS